MTDFTVSAHAMALLSQKAYGPNPDVDIDGVEVFLTEIDTNIWAVAFRGTSFNFADIISDIRIAPWLDCKLGLCHKGFLESARSTYMTIYKMLEDRHAINVVLTGHSLGAARATLTAAWLTWEFLPSQLRLITFGSPRTGRTLEKHLKGVRNSRYVHGADIVTTVPWPIIYRHVGGDIPIGKAVDGFLDHRIAKYAEALEE